ncbi:3' terminal RNA ribose 2'-O-methyltransferase Hen1 [Holophaga foetida]|uniref:3' terminal RNA ribose 2'-O-methyltransferase Hen1 n=1 Tax=Holophaga foetida TaxID=35839 RepID=UPI0002471C4D|nr:3' terminal RNA ribose 2'-O-methyltransferase Hen1 [Holophaga foetida]
MLLSLTTTHQPATDLGFLLHKNPDRVQSFELSFGRALVFYPEATAERCTVALQVEVDPVALVRDRRGPGGAEGLLDQYVNDRPYTASSFLSVAMGQVFRSALSGLCKDRPGLVGDPIPLRACLPVLPCRGGESFLRPLFEPLGYRVEVTRLPLDERFPEWGESPYYSVALEQLIPLKDLLAHLYVLIPVLDDDKHYWVGQDEIEKLLRRGEGWLAQHPEREQITHRYLKRQRSLTRDALERLCFEDGEDPDQVQNAQEATEARLEASLSLNERRIQTVAELIVQSGAKRVVDLGCGEGRLLQALMKAGSFDELLGIDVSCRALGIAHKRLHLDELPHKWQGKVQVAQGALTYRDDRVKGVDAAAVVEVIEHMEADRLEAFEQALFGCARPRMVVLTTPNAEYNVRFLNLVPGRLRHDDHRFEWSRAEFRAWAQGVAERNEYEVEFSPIGAEDPEVGAPTQLAIFSRS